MVSGEALVLHKPALAQSGLVIFTKHFIGTTRSARQFATGERARTKGCLLENNHLLALRRALVIRDRYPFNR